jgi:hypothetical protein
MVKVRMSVLIALGDSLAASFQPNGDFEHGYAEQLYAARTGEAVNLRMPGDRRGVKVNDSLKEAP